MTFKSPRLDRRQFLRAAGYGAGLGVLPASIRRALALPAVNAAKSIADVGHVVILMQENRSFDHYFGTLAGVRGFGDRFLIPLSNTDDVLTQRNAKRSVLPYYLDSSQGKALGVGTPHGWGDAQAAWNHGRMSQWPVSKTDYSMGYLKPADLSYHTALANAFTLCDHYHCAHHGGTNTNRTFHWTGTNRGPTARSKGADYCVINNDGWDTVDGTPLANSLTWTTYPERLQAAGVSWKIYQFLPDNYTDNPLSGFKNYRDAFSRVNNGNLASYSSASAVPAVEYNAALHDTPGLPTYEPLYKGIGRTEPTYPDTLAMFRADALSDQLPAVSWIVGPAMYTEHPDYTPAQGAYFIGQVLDALTANPTVWGKTVLFVNYDENDGYFDHLPPPCPPSVLADGTLAGKSTVDTSRDTMNVPNATDLSAGDGRPFGPGPRVPMFVVSPWSRGGYVNSQPHDHTSVLRFLETRFGVKETNISPWRRAMMGDLTGAFDFINPNTDTTFVTGLPAQDPVTAETQYAQQATGTAVAPPAESAQAMPVQATGTRPARALPFAMNVTSSVDATTGHIGLTLANAGSAGDVLHVYDRLHLDQIPRRYGIEPGKSLSDDWAANGTALEYDLWLLGANGFHRLYRGSAASAGLEVLSQLDAGIRTLTLSLVNGSATPAVFTVTAGAHRGDAPADYALLPQGRQDVSVPLTTTMGWYDFTVRGPGGFARRIAGHLENGQASVSDPAMASAEKAAAMSFADKTEVPLASLVVSDPVAIAGFPGYLPIQISDGAEFSLDGGRFVTSAPRVCTGQSVAIRHTSASALNTPVTSTLTIGSTSASFKSVTTKTAAATPDPTPMPSPAPTPTPTPTPSPTPTPTPVPVVEPATTASASSRLGGGGVLELPALAALATAAWAKRHATTRPESGDETEA